VESQGISGEKMFFKLGNNNSRPDNDFENVVLFLNQL